MHYSGKLMLAKILLDRVTIIRDNLPDDVSLEVTRSRLSEVVDLSQELVAALDEV